MKGRFKVRRHAIGWQRSAEVHMNTNSGHLFYPWSPHNRVSVPSLVDHRTETIHHYIANISVLKWILWQVRLFTEVYFKVQYIHSFVSLCNGSKLHLLQNIFLFFKNWNMASITMCLGIFFWTLLIFIITQKCKLVSDWICTL